MLAPLRNCKVEKVTGTKFRPDIAHPYLDVENAMLCATDSFALVRIPVEVEEGDVSGRIPATAISAARKQRGSGNIRIHANERADVEGIAAFVRPTAGTFPDTKKLMPKGKPLFSLKLNPSLLLALADALGSREGVQIDVYDKSPETASKPMKVTPLLPNGPEGILMPIRGPRSG